MALLLTADGVSRDLRPAGRCFTLKELQDAVAGPGQDRAAGEPALIALYALHDGKTLVCNDDGLALGLPLNQAATAYYNTGRETRYGVSPVVGDVVICTQAEVE